MRTTRKCFQDGSLRKKKNKKGFSWEFRYRDHSQPGSPLRQKSLSGERYPTEAKARAALQHVVTKVNETGTYAQQREVTMDVLIDRFIDDEKLLELKALRPGEAHIEGAIHRSTALSYLTTLERYIRPRWGRSNVSAVKAADIDEWLRHLTRLPKDGEAGTPAMLAAKTRGHIKALMGRLIDRAMLWEFIPTGRNPVGLVQIRGVSRRSKVPSILTTEQYQAIVEHLPQPYDVMVQVAMCLGLRVSEVLALKWKDFDFDRSTVQIVRAAIHARVAPVKSESSEDELPLDPLFVHVLLNWQKICPHSDEGWVFTNPNTGGVYHASPIVQDYLVPAGKAAGLSFKLGSHTFRHTYRTLLDEFGAPVGVQQKLMRHAQVSTTMNTYGNAHMHAKRQANGKVVQMVMPRLDDLKIAV